LSEALPLTTIITLNYRLSSPKHLYPLPIHDTATAFTYIANPGSPHNAGRASTISLYGSQIGGSLALMLALSSPNLIHSLAVLEPFVDWEGLDERKSRAKDTQTQDAIAHLLTLRSRIFPKPSSYFDPFASPILFLRAPGRDTPASHSSPLTEDEDVLHPATNSDADAFGPHDDEMTSALHQTPSKRRKVLRRWPPHGRPEDVMLPCASIILREGGGLNGVLRDQGKEMADRMRKACFFGREKEFGEERVKTEILPEGEGVVDEALLRLLGKSGDELAGKA
jgi:acetyl esterase/lipase